MAKNKLGDLDNHLFAALERLGDEDLTSDQIEMEVKRAEAIVRVADQVTENAKTKLVAARLFAEHGASISPMLPQIGKTVEEASEG
ncbi:hypothetical protein JQX09_17795 [Sulfitobacter pseudonitzschiae]|uniref:Phage protein n=1 Tax=Pseudosulfitobacter pseudonitzschiae TaxID=1402135 RepID=A0A9Q2RWU2_9RHOB|nr:hypothetical protein [Pseudosulfitobacter pseudonitzschiae]MBM2293784.1 hypothetical protein [Pseudosulfitobacter pseudonitzschiae]MBM2298702.1 hypothetical protein [Pseudosulfitobacter pseudonitzschiae]MBM2303616.1 hypothetical protein [Pseudosulfitobacter pseudonitzschiae]MBM2313399.1 hypothetical protein [Pseudosulfitobacter pseudonitzschiae]MBM2318312.1 hypothetical protein [Pseudosulfitobacter pseudonitzschiae]